MKVALVVAGLSGAVFMFAAHLPRAIDQAFVFVIAGILAVVAAFNAD